MIIFLLFWQLTCLTQPYALIPLSVLLPASTTSIAVHNTDKAPGNEKGGYHVKA